jgi:hypothetical protein
MTAPRPTGRDSGVLVMNSCNSIVTTEDNIAVLKGLAASFKEKSHPVQEALGIV